MKNYKVELTVEDENGITTTRNYTNAEECRTNFNKEVVDIIDSHEKSNENF